MAGLILVGADSSLAIEALYRGGKDRKDPTLSSFEKEISFLIKHVLKRTKRELNHETCQKLSNSLFSLWNKYQSKFSQQYFTFQLLRVADLLYKAGLYHLARTHGYRRHLSHVGLQSTEDNTLEEYVSTCDSEDMILAVIRCEIGDAMCLYIMAEVNDPKLMEQSTRGVVISTLARLRAISQVVLAREDRYWLAHNAFVHTFSLCHQMMNHGHASRVIEYLLWSAVCMESSIPLMACKYLQLRTNIYVAITQCYYYINRPNDAELFARRGLDKVNELAQLEHSSSSEAVPGSEFVYKEATIKLGILVFKKSLFEARKKLKQSYKYKFHLTVKELLQIPSPRSHAEKLLSEMFSSASAQFLAILETLTDYSRRALNRGPPAAHADFDNDMQNDVYSELFAAGVDIALKTLDAFHTSSNNECSSDSIMKSAIEGNSCIPLEALVKFVRIAHIYEQKEVMEFLGERVIQVTQASPNQLMIGSGKALQLMLAMEMLAGAQKSCISASTHKGGVGRKGVSSGQGGRRQSCAVGKIGELGGKSGQLSPLIRAAKVEGKREKKASAMPAEGDGGLARLASRGPGERRPSGSVPMAKGGGPGESRGESRGGRKPSPGSGGGKKTSRGGRRVSVFKGEGKEEGGGARGVSGESGGESTSTENPHTTSPMEELHNVLVRVTHFLHFTIQTTPTLKAMDFDLLLDSLVTCWEILRPALSRITTHDYVSCKGFLEHSTGMLYAQLLSELVSVAEFLELWHVDAVLHVELNLKHCCLLEAKSEKREPPGTVDGVPVTFMNYDRSQLLHCQQELEKAVTFIKLAREREGRERARQTGMDADDCVTDLSIAHVECVYALTRVQVKLASTNPPPEFFEPDDKTSSLKSKIKEREHRQHQKDHLLSQLTSREVKVPDLAQLRDGCGRSHYRQGVLLMLQATTTPGLETAERQRLMEESYNQLMLEQQWLTNLSTTTATTTTTESTSTSAPLPPPPPPILLSSTETSMEFCPPPPSPAEAGDSTTCSEQVAYYKLFGRVAAGSCVKVREVDKILPGLGMEVPAEANCRLVVQGLQPHEDYVFAVAAYTVQGKMVGKAIGQTSKAFRTTFPLPLLTAWGYCCQCAFRVGAKSVAVKSSKTLWNHFVSDDDADSNKTSEEVRRYQLKHSAIDPTLSTHLYFFVDSILISMQLSFDQGHLLMDQLSSSSQASLLSLQLRRIQLVRKLLVGVEVAAILNSSHLCLQLVVKCYGLLAPLLQHCMSSRAVVEMLLHCHAVLMELPEPLLNSAKSGTVTASLHHMIAAMAFYVGKLLLSWHNKPLFFHFMETSRSLLFLTLAGAIAFGVTVPLDPGMEDAMSMVSLAYPSSVHDLPLSSFAAATSLSGLGHALLQSGKKKKGRKRVHILTEHIPEEHKTAEFKALEAFLVAHQQQIEDVDLSGGEDPIILHYIITAHPSIAAHREVIKFKRRPQYLEMLVHLLNSTLAKGHFDRVMEWASEGFQWLTRRNEVLLNPRFSQRIAGEHVIAGKGRLAKATHLFSHVPSKPDLRYLQRRVNQNAPKPVTPPAAGSRHGKERVTSAMEKDNELGGTKSKRSSHMTHIPSQAYKPVAPRERNLASPRLFSIRKSMRPSIAAELSTQIRITKEDLEAKSVYILISKLPDLWKTHRCRQRLRGVCSEELPWRTQANLIMGTCYLNQALGILRLESKEEVGEGEESGGQWTSDGLGFATAGVIIEGVVPSFLGTMAGQGNKSGLTFKSHSSPLKDQEEIEVSPSSTTVHPVLSSSIQALVLENVRQMMACFQRAAVLSERGKLWILLQNTARSLWNAVNSLLLAISRFGRELRERIAAAIYGLACKPLYFVADGLVELLAECYINPSPQLPQVSTLAFTPGMDDANGVGVAAIKQVMFLSIQVLYVQQHWEKVLLLGLQFDDLTNHSWTDQLVPILSSAQTQLSDRVSAHKSTEPVPAQHDKLEPAAHLEPGPKGYDVYGTVGYSLHLVPDILLDRHEITKRVNLMQNEVEDLSELKCQQVLLECRKLLQRYSAGVGGFGLTGDTTVDEYPLEISADSAVVPALDRSRVSLVVGAYEKAVKVLEASGMKDLTVQAMNELGDVLMLAGNLRMGRQWWLEGLSLVLGIKKPLVSWRKLIPITLKGCGGLWACLLGAMMATKLLRYVYWKQLDIRLECALLAACLLKAILTYSLPYPTSDLAYATFDHAPLMGGGGATLFAGVELFSDPFRCNPSHLLCALRWCSQELVTRGYAKKVLPILWLYNHVAVVDCRSVHEAVTAKILRLRVLTQLSLFSAAIQQLQEVVSGNGLPQGSTHCTRPPESSLPSSKFQDHLPISDPANCKILFTVLDKQLRPNQESLYGSLNVSRLVLARALLYTALAKSQTSLTAPLTTSSFSLASGPGSVRPFTYQSALSPPSGLAGTDTPVSSCPSTKETLFPRVTSGTHKNKTNTKLALIYSAERALGVLNQQREGDRRPEYVAVRVHTLLGLAELAVSLQHSVTGYQLSLQALRLLQALEQDDKTGTKGGIAGHLKEVDLYLWMECRYWMGRSLVGFEGIPGGGSVLLEVGEHCEECAQHGEVQLVAEMEFIAAEHALSLLPCQLRAAQQHSQCCLELLNSMPELSHRGQHLCSKATLILADTTCIQGINSSRRRKTGVGKQMVEVFDGLKKTLKKQIEEEQIPSGSVNIYQPRYLLLASCLLRLGHTLVLMASREEEEEEEEENDAGSRCGLLRRGQECFKEGIEVVQESNQFYPCLSAELLFANGWAMAALSQHFRLEESISMLVRCGKILVENGTDYRFASTLFLSLAELYNKRKKLKTLNPKKYDRRRSFVPPEGDESPGKVDKSGWEGKWDKGGWDLGGKENYLSWCMVKSVLKISSARQSLQALASAANNADLTRPLSEKVLHEMPDFILLELQSQCETLDTLSSKPVLLPIESLLPSKQYRPNVSLSWFKIINYFNRLIQRCYWQKLSLHLPDSDWELHFNYITPSVYTKTKAVFGFLVSQCPAFKSCVVPALPQLSMLPGGTFSPWTGGVISHRDPHLIASDTDVTIVWYNNPLPPFLLGASQLSVSDRITGYFAMNFKSVNFPLHAEPYLLGMDSHVFHTSLTQLSKLHKDWKELSSRALVYLDAKASMRPVSRSPSKQRRAEKSILPPEELVKEIAVAVRDVSDFFDSKARDLPRLEPHAVPQLTKVIEPFIHTSFKGDAYYFLKELLSPSK